MESQKTVAEMVPPDVAIAEAKRVTEDVLSNCEASDVAIKVCATHHSIPRCLVLQLTGSIVRVCPCAVCGYTCAVSS